MDEFNNDFETYTQTQEEPQRGPEAEPKKKLFSIRKVVQIGVSAVAFGLIAGLTMQGVFYGFSKAGVGTNGTQLATTTTSTGGSSSSSSDLTGVSSSVMPAIVSITCTFESTTQGIFGQTQSSESEGAGSGIIVGKKGGYLYIATNNHVVDSAKAISVGFVDGKTVAATTKGTDTDADLAVVQVKLSSMKSSTLNKIKVITMGDSSKLKVGERAIAIGNALGYGQSVTGGYISAVDRKVQLTDSTMILLQTDAAINPGNSGGALLNSKGELIGINTVKYASEDVEGMGYAIPVNSAKKIINELIKEEAISESQQAYLGITGRTVSTDVASQYNMPAGVYVNTVVSASPAKTGGISAEDIITKFNGDTVSSIEGLQNKISKKKAGTKVTITVKRKNQEGTYQTKKLTVTLGKKSEDTSNSNSNSNSNSSGSSYGNSYDNSYGTDNY